MHFFASARGRGPFSTSLRGSSSLVASLLLIGLLAAGPDPADAAVTLIARGTDQNGTLLLPGHLLSPGDQVTVDITARSDGELAFALGASATGYDSNGFQFNSGELVNSIFNVICFEDPGCFGGLDQSGLFSRGPVESLDSVGGPEVQIFEAISITGTAASGEADFGVSGIAGDPQARLVFDVLTSTVFDQQASIYIGSLESFGDALVLTSGQFGVVNTVWVVPEPGTGLLAGLGLVGLSARRRRGVPPRRA